MDIPSSASQLFIALLFVIPGSVYQAVRQRLRGPAPDDLSFSNKLFRALGVSAALNAIYFALAGKHLLRLVVARHDKSPSWQGAEQHAVALGWLALLLLFAFPVLLGVGDYMRATRSLDLRGAVYNPIPRAWDYAFRDVEPCFVRILTTDGVWLGGWFGENSFISSYPEPREIFVEVAHEMNPDGQIGEAQPWSAGMYVRCDDVRAVEILRQPLPSGAPGEGGPNGGWQE